MKTARLIGVVLTTMCAACTGIGAISQGAGEAVNADTAVLVWSAFECSEYAKMAGKSDQEALRLFHLGYENGKRFVEAVRTKKISAEEWKRAPMGVTRLMGGITADFILGQISEAAAGEAYNLVVRGDKLGVAPRKTWRMEPELQKTLADTEYRTRNCALLK